MPKTLPLLMARDICRGQFGDHRDRHCLYGWVSEASKNVVAQRQILSALLSLLGGNQITVFNDSPKNPKARVAEVWNKAARKLGYRKRGNKFVLPGL